jgi:hypothetical protein
VRAWHGATLTRGPKLTPHELDLIVHQARYRAPSVVAADNLISP